MSPEFLAALHARCFVTPPPWTVAGFRALLADPQVFLAVAANAGGFVLGRVVVGEAEVLTLAVDPLRRRKGLALDLMTAFESEARARGATEAFLEVAEDNAPARALYAACGWQQRGRRPRYFRNTAGEPVAALILCKSLA